MSALSVVDRGDAVVAREVALRGALGHLEREFGKGTVMRMGDPGAQVRCEAIPTGALSLDLALGIGGMPRGRVVEVFGPESSGKTTLVYHVLARCPTSSPFPVCATPAPHTPKPSNASPSSALTPEVDDENTRHDPENTSLQLPRPAARTRRYAPAGHCRSHTANR
jgi:hypothetical protein